MSVPNIIPKVFCFRSARRGELVYVTFSCGQSEEVELRQLPLTGRLCIRHYLAKAIAAPIKRNKLGTGLELWTKICTTFDVEQDCG